MEIRYGVHVRQLIVVRDDAIRAARSKFVRLHRAEAFPRAVQSRTDPRRPRRGEGRAQRPTKLGIERGEIVHGSLRAEEIFREVRGESGLLENTLVESFPDEHADEFENRDALGGVTGARRREREVLGGGGENSARGIEPGAARVREEFLEQSAGVYAGALLESGARVDIARASRPRRRAQR